MGDPEIHRDFRRRAFENAHLLKCDLDGHRQSANFLLVDLRRCVEHDKEGKQQGDEVGVRYQPAFMIGVAGRSFCGVSYLGRFGFWLTALFCALARNPRTFFQHAWIHSLENGNHAFERHFADDLLLANPDS